MHPVPVILYIRNVSCASGDCLTSRPKGCSRPRELWFSIYSCISTTIFLTSFLLLCLSSSSSSLPPCLPPATLFPRLLPFLSPPSRSIDCDLEGRFSYIRTQETNLGNLVTDIMRRVTRSDIALLNSGTFRSDAIHEAGRFRVKVRHSVCLYMYNVAYAQVHVHAHACIHGN